MTEPVRTRWSRIDDPGERFQPQAPIESQRNRPQNSYNCQGRVAGRTRPHIAKGYS